VPARLRVGHYTGRQAKAGCLLIHAYASLSLSLARPRHVIHHIHELDFYSQMSSYDVAVIICWAQPHRAEVGAVKEIARVEPME
jgi:hypothetical protein